MRIKIKRKSYEVKCPVSGKTVFVRGLNIAEQNILSTPVTSYVQGLNLLMNVVFDTIQNPEVYKLTEDPNEDLYTSFLKQTYWDDFVAISIGILNTMSKEDATLDLNIICPNTEAPEVNEDGICGRKYIARFEYSNLISDFNLNEDQEPIYLEKKDIAFPDYGVKMRIETPNLYKEMQILELIDKLKNSQKVFKKLGISDYHKDAILGVLITTNIITKIESLDNPEEFVELDFDKPIKDINAIEFAQTLTEFDQLEEFTKDVNPKKYGLESNGETKCPKCGYTSTIDLKEWIINTFFPDIIE